MHIAVICAQLLIAVSIGFVWIVRLPNIVKEFHEYQLHDLVRNAVGAAKIALSTLLVAGIWYPHLLFVTALLMAFLMLCAQAAHFRAKHTWHKFVPSLGLLLLCLFVCAANLKELA